MRAKGARGWLVHHSLRNAPQSRAELSKPLAKPEPTAAGAAGSGRASGRYWSNGSAQKEGGRRKTAGTGSEGQESGRNRDILTEGGRPVGEPADQRGHRQWTIYPRAQGREFQDSRGWCSPEDR